MKTIFIVQLFCTLFFVMGCRNENKVYQEIPQNQEEFSTFEFINKSFEERLNKFIDFFERNDPDNDSKNVTIGFIIETEENGIRRDLGKNFDIEVTFMYHKPTDCEKVIGMTQIGGFNVFYSSFGEEIDKKIIKVNKPFDDCLKYTDLEVSNDIFYPFYVVYLFENG